MEMEKKNLAIVILAIALIASGVGNIIFGTQLGGIVLVAPTQPVTLVSGSSTGPVDADPQYFWDQASFDFGWQIYEGLFAYNFSDPDLGMITVLATNFGTWSPDNLNFTVSLRQGVKFHSGYKFNASAVKFSFDRLLFLTNLTGAQNKTGSGSTVYGESIIKVLYMWPDGTSIINRTEIIDEYTIKFVLNRIFGVFLPLLTFSASFIFDPSIHSAQNYICEGMSGAFGYYEKSLEEPTVSGTGPFIFQYYISGIETKFLRNDEYWRGAGKIEVLIFAVINDADARNTALLAGDIDFLDAPNPGYYQSMRDDADLTLKNSGPGTSVSYLGFNNHLINVTWRNAMSYALDYDYIIDELREGEAFRLLSPLPLGIAHANWSFDAPVLDLTIARSYMQSMGFGTTFTTDAEWVAVAQSGSPFRTVNFTYNIGNDFRQQTYVLCEDNFAEIGIKVNDGGLEWSEYLDNLYDVDDGWNKLLIWWIGWMPDYNDPSNYLNSLMSNVSSSASTQCSTPELEAYLLAGLEETDQDIRRQIYHDLQKYVVEELRPWAFGYVGKNMDAFVNEMKGYPSNAMGYKYFYPVYFEA